jgi:hypothetical protein
MMVADLGTMALAATCMHEFGADFWHLQMRLLRALIPIQPMMI